MESKWGGSGIEKYTFDFILSKVKPGSRILELGAGYVSTPNFMEHYDVTSVEHNEEYSKINPNTIYAPEVDGWYNVNILDKELKGPYEFLLIDGINRRGILNYLELFTHIPKILIHDTYRPEEKDLARDIARRLSKNIEFKTEGDYFAYLW